MSIKDKDIISRTQLGGAKVYQIVPTGIRSLDKALGGGMVLGGNFHLWSPNGRGKTNIATHIAKEFQKLNYTVAWDDLENNLNVEWVRRIGLDTELVYWERESIGGEEHVDWLIYHTKNNYGLIIVDTIDLLIPINQFDEGSNDKRPSIARLLSRTLPQLSTYKKIAQSSGQIPTTNIYISQARDNQKSPQGGHTYSGGFMLRHLWTQSIRIETLEYLDENLKVLTKRDSHLAKYYRSICAIERNRAGRNGVPCDIYFNINEAKFDNELMLIVEKLRFIQNGAWYSFKDIKVQGFAKFKEAVDAKPELYQELEIYNG